MKMYGCSKSGSSDILDYRFRHLLARALDLVARQKCIWFGCQGKQEAQIEVTKRTSLSLISFGCSEISEASASEGVSCTVPFLCKIKHVPFIFLTQGKKIN